MELLIMRHGDAVEESDGLGDGARWLSGKGRRVTRQVGGWLVAGESRRPVEIWTSPLVRAVQTAEIIAEAAGLTDEVSVCGPLGTAGDPREIVRRLDRYRGEGPLLLVGHEPSLSNLVSTLLPDVSWVGFKKSGVVGIERVGGERSVFRFALAPKDLTVTTDPKILR